MSNETKRKKNFTIDANRHIGREISEKTYYNLIAIFLSYGFILNMLMVVFLGDFARTINPIAFYIGYFVSAITGIIIAYNSKSTFSSFLGYNLIVLPIGLLLAICLPSYSLNNIAWAFGTTMIVTIGMMIISNIFPKVFRSLGKALFISLILVLIIEIISMLIGVFPGWINGICCILFSLYIGYDWSKAGDNYKTTTNAMLVTIDLYLDIINLFINLLDIKSNN